MEKETGAATNDGNPPIFSLNLEIYPSSLTIHCRSRVLRWYKDKGDVIEVRGLFLLISSVNFPSRPLYPLSFHPNRLSPGTQYAILR